MAFLDSLKKAVNQIDGSDLWGGSSQRASEQNLQQPQPVSTPPTPVQDSDDEAMYSPKIEKLIKMALADGDLTEKEKQVLFKKAEEEGIDLDEFEMVLEAKLYERSQKPTPAQPVQVQSAAPKSEKFGDVKKCPACGAIVQTFTTKCVDCGYEFRTDQANASIQQLFDLIMQIDADRKEVHVSRFDKLYGDSDEDAQERQEELLLKRKVQVIQNFPIPTSRETIIEFLIQAVPLSKAGFFADDDVKQLAKAWKSKCEQIILKAKFALKDDKELYGEILKYAKELKIKL